MPSRIYRRALERGAELLGGEEALARYLRVSPTAVRAWLSGAAPCPGDVFLRVVDLLLERSVEEMKTDAPAISPNGPKPSQPLD